METPVQGVTQAQVGEFKGTVLAGIEVRNAVLQPIALLQIQSQRQGRRGRTKVLILCSGAWGRTYGIHIP